MFRDFILDKTQLAHDFANLSEKTFRYSEYSVEEDEFLVGAAINLLEMALDLSPKNKDFMEKLGRYYHINGQLKQAKKIYRKLLQLDPPTTPTAEELKLAKEFCPIIQANEREFFNLKDVIVAIHPEKPQIAYHFFWEDDYDYPDDSEPSDHEVVWVEYDDLKNISNIVTLYHRMYLSTEEALLEAKANDGRPIIYSEWGKHGNLIKGWEKCNFEFNNRPIIEFVNDTYKDLVQGGRCKEHRAKRKWPSHFDGSFEDYLSYNKKIDPLEGFFVEDAVIKTKWVNALMFMEILPYGFHAKREWLP